MLDFRIFEKAESLWGCEGPRIREYCSAKYRAYRFWEIRGRVRARLVVYILTSNLSVTNKHVKTIIVPNNS